MEIIIEHEEELISSFIIAEKKKRYLALIHSKKGRVKFRLTLSCQAEIDLKYIHTIQPKNQNVQFILNQLKIRSNSENCYVICEQGTPLYPKTNSGTDIPSTSLK